MIQSMFDYVFGRLLLAHTLLVLLLLNSCSGGETGTGDNKKPGNTNASQLTTFIGPITAFGSIFVNGIEFDTAEAHIDFNGDESGEHALMQGMLVKIDGQVDDSGTKGVAYNVSYCSVLNGPIDQIMRDPVNGTLQSMQLLGQTVRVDKNTLMDSAVPGIKDLNALQAGYRIEVSGFQGLHEILATHIELIDSDGGTSDGLLVNGPIMTLTPENFSINQLTIYYDGASLAGDFAGGLRSGMIVSVTGRYLDTPDGRRFTADRITIDKHDQTSDMLELEGYIVEPLNAGVLRVNRFLVTLGVNVEFENGDVSSLAQVGLKLQLRGHLTTSGLLEVHKITIKQAPTVEFVSNLQQVDVDQSSFVVFGRRVFVNNHTIVKDSSEQNLKAINLSNFVVGDRIDCDLQYDASLNQFIATKLKRDPPSSDLDRLKGPLLSVEGKGNNIVVNIAGMELELASSDNHLFFNREIGAMVSVTGSYNSLEDVFEVNAVEFSM